MPDAFSDSISNLPIRTTHIDAGPQLTSLVQIERRMIDWYFLIAFTPRPERPTLHPRVGAEAFASAFAPRKKGACHVAQHAARAAARSRTGSRGWPV
jgi:hypothetical protein